MSGSPPKPGSADIEISSGDYLNLANPDPTVITLDVVAHHLTQVARYAGAPRRRLSVCEHSLLVAAYLEHHHNPPEIVLGGLHHDDAEAFIGDATRPLKELLSEFPSIERRVAGAIDQALGLTELGVDIYHPAVKEADNWALATEAYYGMPSKGKDWWSWGLFDPNNKVSNIYEVIRLSDGEPQNLSSTWRWRHIQLRQEVIGKVVVSEGAKS